MFGYGEAEYLEVVAAVQERTERALSNWSYCVVSFLTILLHSEHSRMTSLRGLVSRYQGRPIMYASTLEAFLQAAGFQIPAQWSRRGAPRGALHSVLTSLIQVGRPSAESAGPSAGPFIEDGTIENGTIEDGIIYSII